jgi:cell wall-associated NlpC family hydrolase
MGYWQQVRADVPRWVLRVAVALSVVVAVLYLTAEVTPLVRKVEAATVGVWLLAGIFHGTVWLRRSPRARGPAVIVLLLLAVWLIWAGRPPDPARLRETYVRQLLSYRSTRYVWGGETHAGIDCSGLARVAWLEAMVSEGLCTANPRLLGPELWTCWWNDVSATAFGDGAFGYTRPVTTVPCLDRSSHAGILPGDLAIALPRHVLIYIGKRRWIEATSAHGVAVFTATPTVSRRYYQMPVRIVRWRWLD